MHGFGRNSNRCFQSCADVATLSLVVLVVVSSVLVLVMTVITFNGAGVLAPPSQVLTILTRFLLLWPKHCGVWFSDRMQLR